MDYRRMYDDSDMLYAYDLEEAGGRDVVVVIDKVYRGELVGEKGRKTKKPFVTFVGRSKKLALNKTNGKAIAKMYGKDADRWPGMPIALYVTQTDYDGETRDCIRIRNQKPEMPAARSSKSARGGRQQESASAPPVEPERTTTPPAESSEPHDAADDDSDLDVGAEGGDGS